MAADALDRLNTASERSIIMSTLPEYPNPILRIRPEEDSLGEIVGVIADLPDSTFHFLSMTEYDYPETLRYGIKRDGQQIMLMTLDVKVDLFTFSPKVLAYDGDMGKVMMNVSNFMRDAFTNHLHFTPMYLVGNPRIPVWRGNIRMSHKDPISGRARKEDYNLFYTFPTNGHSYVRMLFDYRDYAWNELDRSTRGKLVSMRDEIVKGS